MEYKFKHKPTYTLIEFNLSPGEKIVTESDAMVMMDPVFEVDSKIPGGFFKGLARKFLAKENMFLNEYITKSKGRLFVTSALPGDISSLDINNKTIYLMPGAYVASTGDIQVGTQFAGFKSLFSRMGLFIIKISGSGKVFFSNFGGIIELNVSGNYIIDTGHVIGFEDTLNYSIEKVGSLKSTFFSGEGLVCNFTGNGKVWISTRAKNNFIDWLIGHLPA